MEITCFRKLAQEGAVVVEEVHRNPQRAKLRHGAMERAAAGAAQGDAGHPAGMAGGGGGVDRGVVLAGVAHQPVVRGGEPGAGHAGVLRVPRSLSGIFSAESLGRPRPGAMIVGG